MKKQSLIFLAVLALLVTACGAKKPGSSFSILPGSSESSSNEGLSSVSELSIESSGGEESSSSSEASSSKESSSSSSSSVQQYVECSFYNYDNTLLWNTQIRKGENVTYGGQTPTREATAQYSFEFKGWDKPLTNINTDTSFTAQYNEILREYTITFVNEDGSSLYSATFAYGETPVYGGQTPYKAGDPTYNYTFSGWTPSLSPVTGNATYVATFSSNYTEYLVTYQNDNGDVLASISCHYGDSVPAYNGSTPTKEATAQYSYTFTGWDKAAPTSVTGNITFVAQYSETLRTYTVTWTNWNNEVLEVDENVPYGTVPSYDGETPVGPSDDAYYANFINWTGSPTSPITGDVTFKAVYNFVTIYHTVTWKDTDGNVLKVEQVRGGEIPSYTDEVPVKEATRQQVFYFDGWEPAITKCLEDVTYTAKTLASSVEYTKNSDGTWNAEQLHLATIGGSISITNTINDIPVTTINQSMFKNNTRVSQVHIRALSIAPLSAGFFSGCTALATVTLPYAYNNKYSTYYSDPTNCLFCNLFSVNSYEGSEAQTQHFKNASGQDVSTTRYFPETFNRVIVLTNIIPEYFCADLDTLSSVELGEDVHTIDERAFYNCTGMHTFTCPGVDYFDRYCLANCTKLTSFSSRYKTDDSSRHSFVHFSDGALDSCTALTSIFVAGAVHLGVPFLHCTSLKTVTMEKGVLFNNLYPFSYCTAIEEMTIPFVARWFDDTEPAAETLFGTVFAGASGASYEGLVKIVQSFDGTNNRSSYVPSSLRKVTVMGGTLFRGTFMNFNMITNMTIGKNVVSIGEDCFRGCTGLTKITYKGTIAEWQALPKGNNYKQGVTVTTIKCSDGDTAF